MKIRNRYMFLVDALIFVVSAFFSSFIVYRTVDERIVIAAPAVIVSTLIMLFFFHFYNIKIEKSSIEIVTRSVKAFAPVTILSSIISTVVKGEALGAYCFVLETYALAIMLSYRFLVRYYFKKQGLLATRDNPLAIVYGAGEVGTALAREQFKGRLPYNIIGYVDDSPKLHNMDVLGFHVMGTVDELAFLLKANNIKCLIIAITNLSQDKMYKAVDAAKDNGCEVKIIPSLFEIQQGAKEIDLRNLDYPDLLGRPLIQIDKTPVEAMVKNKVVLVTGACGSIGSEISKQLIDFGVKQLIMIDIDESGLHDIGLRLSGYKTEISERIVPILCDIKNRNKIDRIYAQFKPEIVYHAAAYKHVPMGEREPDEIIKTNVIGSYNVLSSAKKAGVKRVVIISTDKAVNPTNVMGASKRMVELVASMLTSKETEIVAVRFGNVLGSRGSMLPLFIEQIHAGVPITVTHKDIIRYFMAIPEAVSLVLKAGAMAQSGEVMVLDMGQPVRIYDFAQKLVKYYGDGRSQVVVTGLRPGEKLYEELLADEDLTIPTDDKLVFKAKLNDHKLDVNEFNEFKENIESYTEVELVEKLNEFVPEFDCQHSKIVLG